MVSGCTASELGAPRRGLGGSPALVIRALAVPVHPATYVCYSDVKMDPDPPSGRFHLPIWSVCRLSAQSSDACEETHTYERRHGPTCAACSCQTEIAAPVHDRLLTVTRYGHTPRVIVAEIAFMMS